MINKEIIKGHWKEIKGKIKQQWGKLTDDDVSRIEGSYDELEGALQKKYGYKKEEVEKLIDSFVGKCNFEDKSDKQH